MPGAADSQPVARPLERLTLTGEFERIVRAFDQVTIAGDAEPWVVVGFTGGGGKPALLHLERGGRWDGDPRVHRQSAVALS